MANILPAGTSPSSNAAQSQNSSNSSTGSGMDKLANEQTFLQLFVSQLKNQDPLNPADGTQFVSQLAQFSELEQVIGINQNVGAIRQQVAPATADTGTGTSQSTSGS